MEIGYLTMREYEIATVLKIGVEDGGLDALIERIEGWIVAAGGEVASLDNWGHRKLAYPIKKQQEGNYVFWYATLPSDAPSELERQMRLHEDILRFMVTRTEISPQLQEEDVMEEEQEEIQSDNESGATREGDADGSDAPVESINSESDSA